MFDDPLGPLFQGGRSFTRLPLWEQARRYLIEQLSKGVWSPGDMLPSEKDLSARLSISPGTVRRAVESLVEEGILYRIQGRGTFVQSYKASGYTNQYHRFFFDKTNDIVPFDMRLVSYELVPVTSAAGPARILNLVYDQKLIHALRVFSWEGRDVGISELWLDSRRFAKMTRENLSHHTGSLYSYYESELGVAIVDAKDTVKAKCFTEKLAALGNFRTGAPYLELTRIGYTYGAVPVEYRLSYCTSEDFHMAM